MYVCGASASAGGLTVALGREAGALVLADKGVCCVDELDKVYRMEEAALLLRKQHIGKNISNPYQKKLIKITQQFRRIF